MKAGDSSVGEIPVVSASQKAILGDELAVINIGGVEKVIKNAVLDETYGIKIGYYSLSGELTWVPDNTRATTKFINGLNHSIKITTKGNYRIAGIFKFDSNFNRIDYTIVDATTYNAQAGYYYAPTFKTVSGGDITLSDCLDNIFIGNSNIKVELSALEFLVDVKLIKLAKWGPAGNPTDLQVGDIYTGSGIQLIRVDAIDGGVVTEFTELPFEDGAIYTLYNELYIYNGTRLIKANRVTILTGIGTLANSGITATGQFYYNTVSNSIWRCTNFNTTPNNSTFMEMNVLANTETLYLCKGSLFYFNGTTMVSTIGKIIPMGDELVIDSNFKPRNVAIDENYGLQVGYIWDGYYSDDSTRVSTKLLNALTKDLNIKVASDDFEIRGYTSFDADYNRIAYNGSPTNRKVLTLPKGYYYSVVFSKINTGVNITPDEIAPYIWIDDRITLNELVNNVSSFIDVAIDIVSLAETNAWYTGTEVGATIEKITYSDCYAIKYPVTPGQVYELSAKGGSSGRGWYCLDADDKIVDLAPSNFNSTIQLTIPANTTHLIIQSNNGIAPLSLKLVGTVSQSLNDIAELQSDVTGLQTQLQKIDSFKCNTSFLWNKLARLKTLNSGFCNIGFIGDSWTQGTEDIIGGVNQGDFQSYVKPLTKKLQDEYGYGGLGWFDFARDGGNGQMFGCANMWENITYAFTGTITGLDGHNDQQAPNCLGICCAHIIFSNNATLSLTFGAGMLDKFKIRYYKDAHFTISVNGGAATEITANSTDGWQETEIGTTGTDITSVLITSLADNTIIFGMDCFYGTKGVRCHKIGNRSIEASDYLKMNATQWEHGIAKLELSWASVLLAINDLSSSTDTGRMDTIVTNIGDLIDRLKVATDDGNGLVTCDINLLGVENIEDSRWLGLGQLAEKQKVFAAANGYGWTNTDKCIGKTKAEFIYNGTFSDQIHLNKIGCYAYAEHIYNTLFKF